MKTIAMILCNEKQADKLWDFQKYAESEEFKTMEQLWLAFVMKECFNKTWNGKQWIA